VESRVRSRLPEPLPAELLFVSAGSGITPIMSMLRSIDSAQGITDAVHLHSARTAADVIFGAQLRELARRSSGFRLEEQHAGQSGRIFPVDLDEL